MPGYSSTGWNVETHNGVRKNWDLYELKKHPFSIEYRKMAVLEGLKVKFSCFKGIVHPTHFLEVGWGTWLDVGLLLELKPDEKRSKITAKDLILGD